MELACIITDDVFVMLQYRAEHQAKWLEKQGAKIVKTEYKNGQAVITYNI